MALNIPSKFLKCDSEIFREVYSYLPEDNQNQMDKVAEAVHGPLLSWSLFHRVKKLREYVEKSGFGAAKWERYFGKVEKIRLPLEIYDVLQSSCPFFPEKKIGETHFLFYLPQKVGGDPLTLNSLEKLIKNLKEDSKGNPIEYGLVYNRLKDRYGDQAIDKSCWVLVTKNVIPESPQKSFDKQCALIPSGQGYQVPKVWEAVAGVFLRYIAIGDSLLPSEWIYTLCQEQVDGCRVSVSGVASSGSFDCSTGYGSLENFGITVLRKFSK